MAAHIGEACHCRVPRLIDKDRSPPLSIMSFAVRSSGEPEALVPAVRAAVVAAHPGAGLDAVAPMRELRCRSPFSALSITAVPPVYHVASKAIQRRGFRV